MATYNYQAEDKRGDPVNGMVDAPDEAAAKAAIKAQGLWPRRVQLAPESPVMSGGYDAAAPTLAPPPVPGVTLGKPQSMLTTQTPQRVDIAPFLVSAPLPELALMYRQFSTLMAAGVPMVQSLTTLAQQTRHGRLKSILEEASAQVSSGNPLSSVMERHPSTFNDLQIEMIRAGETGGMLEQMASRIAEYLEREIEIRRKLKRETLYPKIVLFVAWIVGGILIFIKMAGKGGVTGYVTSTALILGGSFGVWWLARFLNQFPQFGAIWDQIKMMIPGSGGVARKYATARFTRALAALYSGGILLPQAVATAAKACGNRAIAERMLAGVPVLMAGKGLAEMLAHSGQLSPIAVQMARTGEQTGNLDTMMEKVADYLESEADTKAHQLAVSAGVAALIFAAAIVLLIAVSFYSGQMTSIVNQAEGE